LYKVPRSQQERSLNNPRSSSFKGPAVEVAIGKSQAYSVKTPRILALTNLLLVGTPSVLDNLRTKRKSNKPTISSENEIEMWHLRQSAKTVLLFKTNR